MSINVTVNGNPVHIRRGRMVLSDLDQIKKNERDRRRRLRLEQVRQQSKEISNRLLERAKNIAKEELSKLEHDNKSGLRQIYDRKIMEIQQKYQEDMADIGQAHVAAILEPNSDMILEEERRRNKLAALRRGKEAVEQVKEAQQKETSQEIHQERLRQVRELEDLRSSMIAKLPKKAVPEEHVPCDTNCLSDNQISQKSPKKKRSKKFTHKKSPEKITKSPTKKKISKVTVPDVEKVCISNSNAVPSTSKVIAEEIERVDQAHDSGHDDKAPRKTVPVISTDFTKANKIASYNPEDYTQEATDSNPTDSSSSISDDSSYFSDSNERPKCVRTAKPLVSTDNKVRVYDHNTRQRNLYNRPVGVVEKIDVRNEPNAIDAAREAKQAESIESQLAENRILNAQKRGECAILREKIRRDYKALLQNLDQFTREERKLKASQVQNYPNDVNLREQQRAMLREQHKQRLDHAFKTIIDKDLSDYAQPPERIITLPPKESNDKSSSLPDAVWREPCCRHSHVEKKEVQQSTSKAVEKSRQEQILDMLKKVEKQKRLLLQEFGADLPEDIFHASMKPLFEREKLHSRPEENPQQEPDSPQIKVIKMPSKTEDTKATKTREKSKSPVEKVEIAVQTAIADPITKGEDKSIQVEVVPQNCNKIRSTSNNVEPTAKPPHPIEPKVTVITPEADTSESTSSVITGVTIDIDKEEVKVTPKKKKAPLRLSKRTLSRTFQKSRSVPPSKTSSPVKRFSKSLPGSRQSTPKKSDRCVSDSPSKKIDIYLNKGELNIKVQPTESKKVGVDASTQSSQVFPTEARYESTPKPYRIQSQMKKVIKLKDTSDTSTSFASLPPMEPRNIIEVLNGNTPILEMLDSSANETLKALREDISPVSTPETPSPRTMMMPSNVPRPDKIIRVLKYTAKDTQTNDSTTLSSTKNDQSTSTDPSDCSRQERRTSQFQRRLSKRVTISPRHCSCRNVGCQLMHTKLNGIHDYALQNCPEILKKYEDLQNMCTERIASLTNLIEKVRNEQKGMEFSVISTANETSLMQLPVTKPTANDLQSVRRLVESIEAIHNQLAKTLFESQRIIRNEVVLEEDVSLPKESELTILPNDTVSKDTTEYMELQLESKQPPKPELQTIKAKPKIISDEKVNIQLSLLRMQSKSETIPAATTSNGNSWPSPKPAHQEEDVIEQLSKEILEQSKSLSKTTSAKLSKINNSLTKHKIQTSRSVNDSKISTSPTIKTAVTIDEKSEELTRDKEFVPLLAGIPKVPRTTNIATSSSGRLKPPVTLHSGPFSLRTEIDSSGHELSTIVEFDTTDTANRSQSNIKSPASMKKSKDMTAFVTGKPSVHVAPLLSVSKEDAVSGKSQDVLTKSVLVSTHRSQEAETTSNVVGKAESIKAGGMPRNENVQWTEVAQDKNKEELPCRTDNQDIFLPTQDVQPVSSMSTDRNNQYINNKDKITSTSSNSFSGLSGISEITSTPSSELLKYASSPEEMETALKKLRLGWLITTLKKTREASALSSSSNSDMTPINTARRMISPAKKQLDSNMCALPDFSDVSSISIKEASKSTEQAVLLKGRTSTPKLQGSNSHSAATNSSGSNSSENCQEPSDSLIVPNVSLLKVNSNARHLGSL